ncbi:hypothetical protein TTHERM_00160840 (macronuclear) [Tetrahymena thermophila SB210]|uniref:Uncharacterized protein n=1 Tax=Tetrahymena thermophila (strain SB210) TaxID=312017 RepID=Q22W48_TETTS|nr:hypothetical protein TTHERM_00160840 [Tetrahymena thermophila SB210]EAR89569.1 hypothetical protein TTHERM_00160840 [Tetrahymena thermophila SB210]|eukprot:XP_001009814.1 hypothetical protein TTHERM_00160840 [Tetrahymena thermophila SB210]
MEGNTTTETSGSESDSQYYDSFGNSVQGIIGDFESFDHMIHQGILIVEQNNNDKNSNQLNQNYANDETYESIQFKGSNHQQKIKELNSSIGVSCMSKIMHDTKIFYFCKMYKFYAIALIFLNKQTKSEDERKLLFNSCQNFEKLHNKLKTINECKNDDFMKIIQKQISHVKINNQNEIRSNENLILKKIEQERKDYIKSLLRNLNFLLDQIICQLDKSTKLEKVENQFYDLFGKMKFKHLNSLLFENQNDQKAEEIKREKKFLSENLTKLTISHIDGDPIKCQNSLLFNLK